MRSFLNNQSIDCIGRLSISSVLAGGKVGCIPLKLFMYDLFFLSAFFLSLKFHFFISITWQSSRFSRKFLKINSQTFSGSSKFFHVNSSLFQLLAPEKYPLSCVLNKFHFFIFFTSVNNYFLSFRSLTVKKSTESNKIKYKIFSLFFNHQLENFFCKSTEENFPIFSFYHLPFFSS